MALELAPDGIRVNAIALGVTETAASRTTDTDPEAIRPRSPLGRRGRPEEQAGAILFLCCPTCPATSPGQILLVDGGLDQSGAISRCGQHHRCS